MVSNRSFKDELLYVVVIKYVFDRMTRNKGGVPEKKGSHTAKYI